MIVLGLHSGADAACAVVRDGKIVSIAVCERHLRIKHARGLDEAFIRETLADAGLTIADVVGCAIAASDGIRIHPHGSGDVSVTLAAPAGRPDAFRGAGVLPSGLFPSPAAGERFLRMWHRAAGLAELAEGRAWEAALDEAPRQAFHRPVTVALLGRSLSATVVDFQMALAAAAFYTSGWRRAAVITNGSRTDDDRTSGGWLLLGDGLCLYPLFPHGLVASAVYDATASALNLGPVGGAGKLMGLAAYGRSAFFDARFVGNAEDLRRRGLGRPADDWLEHVRRQARAQGYDLGPLALPERMTEPINADLAASTQAVFEETVLAAANTFAEAIPFDRGDIDGLCLAGAAALNCPANTRLFRDGPFRHLWVPPWCDDSGAAAGAALALFHNILGLPRGDLRAEPAPTSAYLGIRQSPTQVEQALLAEAERVIWTRPEDWARAAAEDLAAGRIIAWFEGRSEVGPRALGHRSLLADPRQANNWPRVNRIKGREAWRPLAPAVLAEEAAKWFEAAPLPSPFMLFTARVLSDAIPAATHVDGSARVQTVGPEAGAFRRLLEAFYRITGVPIVLNTSLNGPGEPIVETPADALALFLRQAVDALYMEGIRVRRR